MKVFEGIVVSAKLPKTVTVLVERYLVHPMYQKRIRRTDKYLCHDEVGVKEGELVSIQECRPMSARKRFIVISKSVANKVKAAKAVSVVKKVK